MLRIPGSSKDIKASWRSSGDKPWSGRSKSVSLGRYEGNAALTTPAAYVVACIMTDLFEFETFRSRRCSPAATKYNMKIATIIKYGIWRSKIRSWEELSCQLATSAWRYSLLSPSPSMESSFYGWYFIRLYLLLLPWWHWWYEIACGYQLCPPINTRSRFCTRYYIIWRPFFPTTSHLLPHNSQVHGIHFPVGLRSKYCFPIQYTNLGTWLKLYLWTSS